VTDPAITAAVGLASALAGAGAWLIWSSATRPNAAGATDLAGTAGPTGSARSARPGARASASRLERAGLGGVARRDLVTATAVAGVGGGAGAFILFGAVAPAVLAAVLTATFPAAAYRRRRAERAETARSAWPRLLEEIRLRTGSLGRSIPQALFEAGRGAPDEWRSAFDAAEREWLLTVDFGRTVNLLKYLLADPTADAVCETLLMAQEIGGADLDTRLAELVEDRTDDLESRRDASSRLAGVRFARRFVLLVPLGMAGAGLTIGTGRHAYATAGGQIAVLVGLLAVAACWWWSGRLMRMPETPRVFG
jgi:tight adherence protein B